MVRLPQGNQIEGLAKPHGLGLPVSSTKLFPIRPLVVLTEVHRVTEAVAPFRPPNWYPFSPPPTIVLNSRDFLTPTRTEFSLPAAQRSKAKRALKAAPPCVAIPLTRHLSGQNRPRRVSTPWRKWPDLCSIWKEFPASIAGMGNRY
jgi:hypothetical protein